MTAPSATALPRGLEPTPLLHLRIADCPLPFSSRCCLKGEADQNRIRKRKRERFSAIQTISSHHVPLPLLSAPFLLQPLLLIPLYELIELIRAASTTFLNSDDNLNFYMRARMLWPQHHPSSSNPRFQLNFAPRTVDVASPILPDIPAFPS